MKLKSILLCAATAAAFPTLAQTWVSDSVVMGAGYAKDSYYNLSAGEVKNISNTNWHLAFEMVPPGPYGSVAIWANHAMANVRVFSMNMSAAARYSTPFTILDTLGKSARPLYNSDSSWNMGAFNRNKSSSIVDYGWGIYDMNTHYVNGDSIYWVKVGNANYRMWVTQYVSTPSDSVHYSFHIADFMTGANDKIVKVYRKPAYTDRLFAYYDITANTIFDREPAASNWDFVFTRYMIEIPLGPGQSMTQPVTGVLSNFNTPMARAQGIPADQANMNSYPYSTRQNVIGYDWKAINTTNTAYNIVDSLSYFIKSTINNRIYQLRFTRFDISPAGKAVFQKRDLGALNVGVPELAAASLSAFYAAPNPAGNQVAIVLDAVEATDARISFIDLAGRTVQSTTVSLVPGLNAYEMNTSSLPGGMYIVQVSNSSWKLATRLVVQH